MPNDAKIEGLLVDQPAMDLNREAGGLLPQVASPGPWEGLMAFTQIPDWLMKRRDVPATEKLLLGELLTMQVTMRSVFAGIPHLAEKIGLKERQTRDLYNDLLKRQWIAEKGRYTAVADWIFNGGLPPEESGTAPTFGGLPQENGAHPPRSRSVVKQLSRSVEREQVAAPSGGTNAETGSSRGGRGVGNRQPADEVRGEAPRVFTSPLQGDLQELQAQDGDCAKEGGLNGHESRKGGGSNEEIVGNHGSADSQRGQGPNDGIRNLPAQPGLEGRRASAGAGEGRDAGGKPDSQVGHADDLPRAGAEQDNGRRAGDRTIIRELLKDGYSQENNQVLSIGSICGGAVRGTTMASPQDATDGPHSESRFDTGVIHQNGAATETTSLRRAEAGTAPDLAEQCFEAAWGAYNRLYGGDPSRKDFLPIHCISLASRFPGLTLDQFQTAIEDAMERGKFASLRFFCDDFHKFLPKNGHRQTPAQQAAAFDALLEAR